MSEPPQRAWPPTAAQHGRWEFQRVEEDDAELESEGGRGPAAEHGKCKGCRRVHNPLDIMCVYCVMLISRANAEASISRASYQALEASA